MKREFKVGDWVIYINKLWSNIWKSEGSPALYGKLAKIISINKYSDCENGYLLEFKEWIGGHDGDGKGKPGHCKWCRAKDMKLAINHLKFKKWIGK